MIIVKNLPSTSKYRNCPSGFVTGQTVDLSTSMLKWKSSRSAHLLGA